MELVIRPGRPNDLESITAFTQDTFSWGDYVAQGFLTWLEDPDSHVLVAVDAADRAVALVRVRMMSSTEAWLASARVHPEYRRRGLATHLNHECMDWARTRGALVGRLAVEEWNERAWRQALKLGFRPVSRWVFARRSVSGDEPDTTGNGGRRVPSEARLSAAGSVESEPAYAAWATSDLARVAHGLFPIGWAWRKMTINDVRSAAERGRLFAAPEGWVIAYPSPSADEAADAPTETWTSWLTTGAMDALGLTRAVVHLAAELGSERIQVMAPAVEWLTEALAETGYELNPLTIYEKETETKRIKARPLTAQR
jgi:GNAT superfamily N-acetyltransferase